MNIFPLMFSPAEENSANPVGADARYVIKVVGLSLFQSRHYYSSHTFVFTHRKVATKANSTFLFYDISISIL